MQFKFFSNPNFARCLYSVNECVSLCDRRVLLKLWNFIFRETICAKHIETQGNILNYKADAQCDLYFLRILFIHNTYVRTSHGRKWMNGQSAMISLLRSTNLDECEHGRFHLWEMLWQTPTFDFGWYVTKKLSQSIFSNDSLKIKHECLQFDLCSRLNRPKR